MELRKQSEGHSVQNLVQERLVNREAICNCQDEWQKRYGWISLAVNLRH